MQPPSERVSNVNDDPSVVNGLLSPPFTQGASTTRKFEFGILIKIISGPGDRTTDLLIRRLPFATAQARNLQRVYLRYLSSCICTPMLSQDGGHIKNPDQLLFKSIRCDRHVLKPRSIVAAPSSSHLLIPI